MTYKTDKLLDDSSGLQLGSAIIIYTLLKCVSVSFHTTISKIGHKCGHIHGVYICTCKYVWCIVSYHFALWVRSPLMWYKYVTRCDYKISLIFFIRHLQGIH